VGRGAEHFFAERIKLENQSGEDPYRELAKQTLTAGPAVEAAVADAEPRHCFLTPPIGGARYCPNFALQLSGESSPIHLFR
jgi:hypothetical protein